MVKEAEINESGYFASSVGNIAYSEMFPYREDSVYADKLVACTYSNLLTVENLCQFSTLPLIGQDTEYPTVDDVMDRVIVSHEWMGDRFQAYLETVDVQQDMLALLRSVTAVVISYEIRPTHFNAGTGAVYFDARSFAVTPEEVNTLNDMPDYRSNFGNDLQFSIIGRYVKDGENYFKRGDYSREARDNRPFELLSKWFSPLMYHELAHANDYFPASAHGTIPMTDSPLAYYFTNEASSTELAARYPLNSSEMFELAYVRYFGLEPSTEQLEYDASKVTSFFEPDNAVGFYAYSTPREDFAGLFERFMMMYRFNAFDDVAILDNESSPIIFWGQRNRIRDPKLKDRVLFAVENIFPDLDAAAIYASFPSAQDIPEGTSWEDSLVLNPKELNDHGSNLFRDSYVEIEDEFYRSHHLVPLPVK